MSAPANNDVASALMWIAEQAQNGMTLRESWGGSQSGRPVPCLDCYSPNLCGRGRYCLYAQGIEAQRAETTQIGSVADESPVPKGCAQTQSSTPDNKDKPNG